MKVSPKEHTNINVINNLVAIDLSNLFSNRFKKGINAKRIKYAEKYQYLSKEIGINICINNPLLIGTLGIVTHIIIFNTTE